MFGYVALAIVAFFFIFIPEATFIIFGGVLISLVLLGIVCNIKKRVPGSKTLHLVFTTLGLVLGALGIVWLLSSRIAMEMEVFAEQLPVAIEDVINTLEQNLWFNRLMTEAEEGNWVQNFIAPKVLPQTAKLATIVLNGTTAFGIALVLGIYFALDSKRYGKVSNSIVPRDQEEKYRKLFQGLHDNLQNWLLGKLLSMVAVLVLTYIGLLLLGIKAAFPLAFIAGFLSFIPNVGPILSAVPAMIIAFAQGWEMSLYVGVVYVIVQALEGTLITPLIQKRKVRVLPAALISFQFIMAILYGFAGLFMATPVLVAIMTLVEKFWVDNERR